MQSGAIRSAYSHSRGILGTLPMVDPFELYIVYLIFKKLFCIQLLANTSAARVRYIGYFRLLIPGHLS